MLCLCVASTSYAENAYRDYFITISDALMQSKQGQDEEAIQTLHTFAEQWAQITSTEKEAKAEVDTLLKETIAETDSTERIRLLGELSQALRTLNEAENPVDHNAQRAEFGEKFTPVMAAFDKALATKDHTLIEEAYRTFNVKWNQLERPVREQSIAMYGQIETQMAFIRIALSDDVPNYDDVDAQFDTLQQTIEDFIAGNDTAQAVEGTYTLQSLIADLQKARTAVDNEDFTAASEALKHFIIIWPQVEMAVSTRDGKLYTKIESTMPLLVSAVSKEQVDTAAVLQQIDEFETAIALLQDKTSYTFWDAALILLREGLEALLIILALVTFLKKANQTHMQKWVYMGAVMGILLSIVAAVAMSLLFRAESLNTSREIIEGYVGIVAAMMMLGVGIWLHRKSTVQQWNAYIERQMGHAISTQSVMAMAMISFLSVFREGAETVIFYVGIAPNMSTSQFLLGIVVAIVILVIVGWVLFTATVKIPIHRFFAVATVLIYALTFKIIGVSIHKLQLMNQLPTHVIDGWPVWSWLGFYPTVETCLGQGILIIFIMSAVVYKRKQKN